MNLKELFTNIANSLRAKTGKTDKIVAENFPSEIDNIKSMSDTNDATATAEDIVEGKTAYVKEQKVIGTMKDNGYNALAQQVPTSTTISLTSSIVEINLNNKDFSNVTSAKYGFSNSNLKKISFNNSNFENLTTMENMFYQSKLLEEIDISMHTTEKLTSMYDTFRFCNSLYKINGFDILDTSGVTTMRYLFSDCAFEELDLGIINISNTVTVMGMFMGCNSLITLKFNQLNFEKVNNISSLFFRCLKLEDIIGEIKNLGKAYTQESTNYSNYILNLSYSNNLTHESLMNIINGLYDLNLSYDVANGGTLYAQTLQLGTTNLAKLTEEEIAIAVSKGWNVI